MNIPSNTDDTNQIVQMGMVIEDQQREIEKLRVVVNAARRAVKMGPNTKTQNMLVIMHNLKAEIIVLDQPSPLKNGGQDG